ncbi:hypothetical protein [Halalkalibaculum sp. DA384]|uniref:hypothetical protein n=1 Tax=Halalkalibaculum sp. DA384 TaxID=3373606 RepID=UPI003754F8D5
MNISIVRDFIKDCTRYTSLAIFLLYLSIFYLFGGLFEMIGIPINLTIISVLGIIVYVVNFNSKIGNIEIYYIILLFIIIVSAIKNYSSLFDVVVFSRALVSSFIVFFVARLIVSNKKYRKYILYTFLFIGCLQLPVLIIQRLFHPFLRSFSAVPISDVDIVFGTFIVKNDPSMSIFLIGLILILMYKKIDMSYWLQNLILFVLTLSVFLGNSQILNISLIIIWIYFFYIKYDFGKLKNVIFIIVIFLTIIGSYQFIFKIPFVADKIERISYYFNPNSFDQIDLSSFQEGGYSRLAAIYYYSNQPFKLIGDGPSRYYNPVSNEEYKVGNKGHIFTFYAEVGFLGLLLSYIIVYKIIAFKSWNKHFILSYFFAAFMLSLTTNFFTDPTIMFSISLISSLNITEPMIVFYGEKENNLLFNFRMG